MSVFGKIARRLHGSREPVSVRVGNKAVGSREPVFLVTKIGLNHNGNVQVAKRMIDAACEAGCDAVKFQKYYPPREYVGKDTEPLTFEARGILKHAVDREVLPPETTTRLKQSEFCDAFVGDLMRALDFTEAEYREIDAYCRKQGIMWFASAFDTKSVDFLEQFDIPAFKVDVVLLEDVPLLERISNTGKPVMLPADILDIRRTKNALPFFHRRNVVLLHTVPAPLSDSEHGNLKAIHSLRLGFENQIPIGYSGQEEGIGLSIAAVGLGARVVERYLTLDKGMTGPDHKKAIEPHELKAMATEIRRMGKAWGKGVKHISTYL